MIHAASAQRPTLALQPQRIAATSLAIGIHLAALALLLIPLSNSSTGPAATPRTQVQWARPSVPTPPPPPPLQVLPPRPALQPTAHSISPPQSFPVLVDSIDPAAVSLAALQLTPMQVQGSPAEPLPSPGLDGPSSALQVLQAPPPPYPATALRQQLQGEVLLRVSIDASGKVEGVSVERSSGHRQLDQAARNQVLRHWRFAPARVNGQPAAAQGLVPINFRID